MIHIDDSELAKFLAGIDAWEVETKLRCAEVWRGLVSAMFNFAAFETPQWSGNAAAQWNISFGAPDFSVRGTQEIRKMSVFEALSKGANTQAVGEAVAHNSGRAAKISLFTPSVYISNGAREVGEESYASKLEENPNNYLRDENTPGAMLSRAVGLVASQLTILSLSQERQLRSLHLGDEANAGVR